MFKWNSLWFGQVSGLLETQSVYEAGCTCDMPQTPHCVVCGFIISESQVNEISSDN